MSAFLLAHTLQMMYCIQFGGIDTGFWHDESFFSHVKKSFSVLGRGTTCTDIVGEKKPEGNEQKLNLRRGVFDFYKHLKSL